MSYHRVFVALALLATVTMTLAATVPHYVTVGSRISGDYLFEREFIHVPNKFLHVIKERRTFPGNHRTTISQIRLFDQNEKGNGATAIVTNGGPGQTYATVKFKSKRGHSINFIVELYGK